MFGEKGGVKPPHSKAGSAPKCPNSRGGACPALAGCGVGCPAEGIARGQPRLGQLTMLHLKLENVGLLAGLMFCHVCWNVDCDRVSSPLPIQRRSNAQHLD